MFGFALAGGALHWLTNFKFYIGILVDCCYINQVII